MEPSFIDPVHWNLLGAAINRLFLWVVFVVIGAGGALFSLALIRSLMVSHELKPANPGDRFLLNVVRPVGLVLLPIGFAVAIWQLSQAIGLIVSFLSYFFPRYFV